MRPTIMLTGSNWRIVVNIAEHLTEDQGYRTIECRAERDRLMESIPFERPQIIVICLSHDERRENLRIYDTFLEFQETRSVPAIVVANKIDFQEFEETSRLNNISFLSRPVSILALYSRLTEIEQEYGLSSDGAREGVPDDPVMFYGQEPKFRKKHILVVDDDPNQLSQIKTNLEEFYDVTAVRSGPDAFRYLETHKADLILLDYMMPDMDGSEVLYRLRTTRAWFHIPVVFMTGVNERETVVKILVELKPQGYIVKPAKKSEVVAKIIDVLG